MDEQFNSRQFSHFRRESFASEALDDERVEMSNARVDAQVLRIRMQVRALRRAMLTVWERLQDGAVMEWQDDEPVVPAERAKTPPRLLTLRDYQGAESPRLRPPMVTPRTGLRLITRERLLRASSLEDDCEGT